MWAVPAAFGRWTRRAFLVSGLAPLAFAEQKGLMIPSAWHRYTDPSTEFEVLRLTDPAHSSWLPPYYNRAVARRNGFLIYASDQNGTMQACRMDLRNGESHELTEAQSLDPASVAMLADEHSFCYWDGGTLHHASMSRTHARQVYQVAEGWERCAGTSVADDGTALIGESRKGASRLQVIGLQKGGARTVVEAPFVLSHPQPRPKRAQILYRQADEALWLVDSDGTQNRKLPLTAGRIGPARWSPDGHTVLYLNLPNDPKELHSIRECTPDQNTDKLVARTSQYAHFGCNANTSVFVGASQNRAAPYILIMLRLTRRELALCEHHASDPAMVAPIFSQDSQHIFFESDRDGKPAIYRIHVEKLVEETEPDPES
ncbi:MAG TPA: oligogalacturonate lyase family protein [Bryobacteraceae bacterium]|nr:oligogalacturonate lyase family protein [Bryobacteraceae bacterium]